MFIEMLIRETALSMDNLDSTVAYCLVIEALA